MTVVIPAAQALTDAMAPEIWLVRNACVSLFAYGSTMLGAPINARGVGLNSGGGAIGSIGFPYKEIWPEVTRVEALNSPVWLRMSMALALVEFAATAHPVASRWEALSTTTPVPVVAKASTHTSSSTPSIATALLAIVTLGRKIDPNTLSDRCKNTAIALTTMPSL